MGNYLFLYHGGMPPTTPEEGEAVMKAWTDWFGGIGEGVVDAGNPTSTTKTVGSGGVTDGSSAVNGYSVIKADSLDAAVALAKGSPQLASGGTVEVVQVDPIM
jgi:hypothetical protein